MARLAREAERRAKSRKAARLWNSVIRGPKINDFARFAKRNYYTSRRAAGIWKSVIPAWGPKIIDFDRFAIRNDTCAWTPNRVLSNLMLLVGNPVL